MPRRRFKPRAKVGAAKAKYTVEGWSVWERKRAHIPHYPFPIRRGRRGTRRSPKGRRGSGPGRWTPGTANLTTGVVGDGTHYCPGGRSKRPRLVQPPREIMYGGLLDHLVWDFPPVSSLGATGRSFFPIFRLRTRHSPHKARLLHICGDCHRLFSFWGFCYPIAGCLTSTLRNFAI